ncbi:fumarylacetoacetase [Enterovirga rhinocerotis]|uniref:fumarylacetoacetase n=1 Tax=Enterovirga rhinocerotis TaxID=1339210 RepID=A0A4R7C514_9HYPH|nr:fumarylacetoacetase [Enterovirga rhinocerotis]TDR93624.1 fumarylacetoacetate hydrolase [Enterovirga rhinocerotis]
MLPQLDATHDPRLASWVASANGHPDFPIQNLPFGIVSAGGGARRAAVAIGEKALDLDAALAAGLFTGDEARAVEAMAGGALNGFLALGAGPRRALRARLSEILREGAPERGKAEPLLVDLESCRLHLPARIGDYTDFYVGIHHATNVGRQFRPDNPLLPNYKWVPIGYHGRASSIVPSGTPIRRPRGQIKGPDFAEPVFTASRRLDYELELGIWIGPGNDLGAPIPIGEADEHIAGYSLLNDWSARDIQAWEYQPLGPFLAKSFASTVSPWIVTPEALAPFRGPQPARPEGDPSPLPYLADTADQAGGALAIALEVHLLTPGLKEKGLAPQRLSRSDARHMYWTAAQIVAHHASGGCNLNPGDFLGTGTISGPDGTSTGSLLEASLGGNQPIRLESGEERSFLQDGDEVVLTARCARDGAAPIGFGECRGAILPAL